MEIGEIEKSEKDDKLIKRVSENIYVFLNQNHEVISQDYMYIFDFKDIHENYVVRLLNDKYVVLNNDLKEISGHYQHISPLDPFENDTSYVAEIEREVAYVLLDKNGKEISKRYPRVYSKRGVRSYRWEGLRPVTIYVDDDGNEFFIPPVKQKEVK